MKRLLLPLLLLFLLLSGCKSDKTRPTPSPVPPTPSPVVEPTPEVKLAWWVELGMDDLPRPKEESKLSDGTTVRCLGQLDEPDIGLYSVAFVEQNLPELYLRHGDQFEGTRQASFFWAMPETLLLWEDFDGDGTEELLFTLREEQRSFLAVARWDDGWTYLPYDSYEADLTRALQYSFQNRTATVTYGSDSASYTMGVRESGSAALHTDFSEYSFFNVKDVKLSAIFGVGVEVSGEVRYFATVNADVEFDGESYTLRNIKLIPFGGV